MSFARYNPNSTGYIPLSSSTSQVYTPQLRTSSFLNYTASEFTPSQPVPKTLNPSAMDFNPEAPLSKANLKADAPVFVLNTAAEAKTQIPEFIPEHFPNEKFDEPIFIVVNRELTEEDLHLEVVTEIVKVDVKNVYEHEEILAIYKELRQNSGFDMISENVKAFAGRINNAFRTKGHKKSKEAFKASNKDWRENEEVEIVSTSVWRKPKTEEEEKIGQKAKNYRAKLTGTKEEHEQIKRKIKVTLNKLSPSNLDKLKEQLLEIGKESTNNLIFLVQCIFEKAWSEVKYTQMYATLCKFLKEKFEAHSFPGSDLDPRRNLFKYELLERCESSFTQTPPEEFTDLTKEQIEEKKSQIKKKTLGNVRFIGELFRVELITSKVILCCVDELLNKANFDEDKIEGACILLSTGGSSFERSKLIGKTDSIFKDLESIMKIESLSSKNKFKIMVRVI